MPILIVILAALLALAAPGVPAAQRGRYKRIDAPGRCNTAALGLNDRGQIVIAAAGTTDGVTCPPQGGDA
jgi:hypothetical protein